MLFGTKTTRSCLGAALLMAVAGCSSATQMAATTPEAPAAESVADPGFLAQWAATSGFRNGQPARIRIAPDGQTVFFLRSGPRDRERLLYAHDVATGQERVLLTAQDVLQGAQQELSAEERALRERLRMTAQGITSYELSADGSFLLVPLSGRLFVVQQTDGSVREMPSEGGYANDPQLSPDGRLIACVRGGNLYVIDIEAGTQRQLTSDASETITNGLAEFVAQEEMSRYHGYWWAPDSASLFFQRTDSSGVETLYTSNPIDPAEAPHGARYPRAGTDNAVIQLGFIPVAGGDVRWIDWNRRAFPYLATVRWKKDVGPLMVVQDRAQQRARVLRVKAADGTIERLHEETDGAWLNIDQSVPRELGDGFLWSTERNGAWQLELRKEDGSVEALTDLPFGYRQLLTVEQDWAWVLASDEPGEQHVHQVHFHDRDTERLSEAPGSHSAVFGSAWAGENGLWVHQSNTVEHGPRWTLRRGRDEIGQLRSVAEAPSFVPNVEYLTVGERDYRAAIVRPRNFEAGRRYPVLLSVYAGPGYAKVRKGRYRQLREQWQADHGFVVVSIDGRGTPGRGREWERAIRGNLIDIPLEDQVAGLQALLAQYPELDGNRVGVYGWSFGGYFSAMAVMRRPDVFRVGVAGAPVCDWRDYDTHYTERFLGLPGENTSGYDASSVLTYAPELQRPLLIIHGTSDDNVYFAHALKMSDALMRAGRSHELIPLAGSTHIVADPQVAENLQAEIMGFLADGLR